MAFSYTSFEGDSIMSRQARNERKSTKAPSAITAEGAFKWIEQLKINELAASPDSRGHGG
jgi:hypothetical protein